jgi:NADH-quinone oxidoreductase subunit J
MILTGVFFYLFAALVLAAGVMVITARNPVHAVLFLIVAFFNSAGLFVLMGAEFIAMILVIVYVGAVAVLFLFVVMMLDIDFVEFKQGFMRYLPVGAAIGAILLVELLLVVGTWAIAPQVAEMIAAPTPPIADISNTEAIGRILYTKYVYFFQAAGLILLVAMVGAIVLTLHHKVGVKRQSVAEQIARDPATAIEIRNVEPGKGI